MARSHLFTSESVSEGHPDKIADQISDTILDAFLTRDPGAHVACETLVANDLVVIAGEFKTDEALFRTLRDGAEGIARQVLRDIGYRDAATGIDPDRCEVQIRFNQQSENIDRGVSREDGELGAGDQGLMFGYASDETPELMPLPIVLAHRLVERQASVRRSGAFEWLRPDAKAQVTVRYEDGRPLSVEKVVLSTQHAPGVDSERLRADVVSQIIEPVIPAHLRSDRIDYLVNPTGAFEIGGPRGDTGLTGRKIIVDTYGGSCPHGGGAFSGKDPTKVDRSGAYMARHVAKNVVAAGLARRCTVQVAYAIGVAEPVSVFVDCHGTAGVDEPLLQDAVRSVFYFEPAKVIRELNLVRPIYRKTAAYGHFGRELPDFEWEATSRVAELREACLLPPDPERSVDKVRLDAAYRTTTFRAYVPGSKPLDLKVGEKSARLNALLDAHEAKSWAFVTAFNPSSRPLTINANNARHAELIDAVRSRGLAFYHGLGMPRISTWEPETSLLIIGMSNDDAVQIGRTFDQLAIVAGLHGGEVALVYCA